MRVPNHMACYSDRVLSLLPLQMAAVLSAAFLQCVSVMSRKDMHSSSKVNCTAVALIDRGLHQGVPNLVMDSM